MIYEAALLDEAGQILSVVTVQASDLLDALSKVYEPVGEELLRRHEVVRLNLLPRPVTPCP